MNMKFKKFALVLAIVLLASTLTPAFASPFADVPADHWAYDAIVQLAAAGLIEGYPDGTYGGARMMTRYEAAMVFARALQRLEGQIAAMDLLPELDRVKAELMAEIEAAKAAAAAAAEKEPIETTVIERVIVDKDVDEETLARIRANEVAIEALTGDMAYLEARMLGLIDGIRYDLNQLKDQPEVEVPSMDEIEELIAKRIEEAVLEAAAAAKETTIIERVVATTPELTKEDVEFIAEALIRTQVQRLELLINENRAMIAALSDWVDELDGDVAVLKEDVAGLKEDVAAVEDRVTALEKVGFSGNLSLNAEKKVGQAATTFTQKGSVALNVKASEATNVKAAIDWELEPFAWTQKLSNYYVEVTSSTPLSRLLVGRIHQNNLSPFGYVLAPAHYGFGGLAKVDIIDDLSLQLFAGEKADGTEQIDIAAALEYKFIDELGLRLKGKATKPYSGMFLEDKYAAGIGLFGKIGGVEYTGNFAMDFAAEEKNYLGVATLKGTFGDVTLDLKGIFEEEKYAIAKQLINDANRLGVEGGIGAKFGVLSLNGRAYYEGLAPVGVTSEDIMAFKADASAKFELFADLTLSGEVNAAKVGEGDMKMRALAKLALDKEADYGLRYGASAQYEHNAFAVPSPSWKNPAHYGEEDAATFAAKVGYGLDLSGAKFDADYSATFVLPILPIPEQEDEADKEYTLTHKLNLSYGFTDNVKLTLGGTVKQTITHGEELGFGNEYGYSAGLTVSF
ncbi:MAG TPA: S-layer homology domain-containing protein [Limnochordia bacterium]|nr:S-layer homology domain-containing protein [Limnochordia bacterium]